MARGSRVSALGLSGKRRGLQYQRPALYLWRQHRRGIRRMATRRRNQKPAGPWTQAELAKLVPARLMSNKSNPSPPQDDPPTWPWVRKGALPMSHASLER